MFVSADEPGCAGSNLEVRTRKHVITPKLPPSPIITGDNIRGRSWTLPSSPKVQRDKGTLSTPTGSGSCYDLFSP